MTSRLTLALPVVGFVFAACSVVGGGRATPTGTPPATADPSPTVAAPTASIPAATPTADATTSAKSDLDGRQFVSQSVVGRKLVSGTSVRLAFRAGRISASAGCNSMGGSYSLDRQKLHVADLAQTDMGCASNLAAQDAWVAELLSSTPDVAIDADHLTLSDGTTTITFLDREVAEPDQPLTMITWGLTTLVEGDVASSIPAGVSAWVMFQDDGSFGFNDGCNGGGGHFTVDDNVIHFSQVVQTMRVCGEDVAPVQTAVSAIFNAGSAEFSIDATTLSLTHSNSELHFAAAVDLPLPVTPTGEPPVR